MKWQWGLVASLLLSATGGRAAANGVIVVSLDFYAERAAAASGQMQLNAVTGLAQAAAATATRIPGSVIIPDPDKPCYDPNPSQPPPEIIPPPPWTQPRPVMPSPQASPQMAVGVQAGAPSGATKPAGCGDCFPNCFIKKPCGCCQHTAVVLERDSPTNIYYWDQLYHRLLKPESKVPYRRIASCVKQPDGSYVIFP